MINTILFILLIGVFLFGMSLLRAGLYNISNEKMENILYKLTSTPVKGMLTGMVLTALIHSSSAVMVITVGLVASRLIPFKQTIGIMLGANIGTTFTLELFTLNMNFMILPAIGVGAIFYLVKKQTYKSIGQSLIGFGLIFLAIDCIQKVASPLANSPSIHALLTNINDSIFLSLMAGTFMTAVIQSSTVVTGVAMGLLASSVLSLPTGIAIMLGANVGTCITAFIASIGGGLEAKRTAYAHIWLNILGVLVFVPFIPYLGTFVSFVADEPNVQLAHASVLFNVICSLLILPFAYRFSRFIERIS